ncbi:C-C motif chemokine 20b [Channa argus]|uniref:C-C motif chemokine 20b n=1 Tax=Channa argus TaxID=215402 RepID=UPI003520B1A4
MELRNPTQQGKVPLICHLKADAIVGHLTLLLTGSTHYSLTQTFTSSMASNRVCLMVALCSLVILTTFISSTQSASCCLKYTKRRLQCKHLTGYTIQNINTSCDIHAIIFHLRDKFVCANPRMSWTQKLMSCVDAMRKNDDKQETSSGTATSA